jgi:hypothetical protein
MKYNLNRNDSVQLKYGRNGIVTSIQSHAGCVLANVRLADGSEIQTSPLNLQKLNK